MKIIKVLGTGCPKCSKMAEAVESAARSLGIEYELAKITDINEIISFGVMMTPALVIDGEVRVVGKIPSTDDLQKMLI